MFRIEVRDDHVALMHDTQDFVIIKKNGDSYFCEFYFTQKESTELLSWYQKLMEEAFKLQMEYLQEQIREKEQEKISLQLKLGSLINTGVIKDVQ